MSRDIIREEDGFGIEVSTFYDGDKECVQITTKSDYSQMSRTEARRFFLLAYNRLSSQILDDEENPPWWQRRKSK